MDFCMREGTPVDQSQAKTIVLKIEETRKSISLLEKALKRAQEKKEKLELQLLKSTKRFLEMKTSN